MIDTVSSIKFSFVTSLCCGTGNIKAFHLRQLSMSINTGNIECSSLKRTGKTFLILFFSYTCIFDFSTSILDLMQVIHSPTEQFCYLIP
jgi:hypothetical protein